MLSVKWASKHSKKMWNWEACMKRSPFIGAFSGHCKTFANVRWQLKYLGLSLLLDLALASLRALFLVGCGKMSCLGSRGSESGHWLGTSRAGDGDTSPMFWCSLTRILSVLFTTERQFWKFFSIINFCGLVLLLLGEIWRPFLLFSIPSQNFNKFSFLDILWYYFWK